MMKTYWLLVGMLLSIGSVSAILIEEVDPKCDEPEEQKRLKELEATVTSKIESSSAAPASLRPPAVRTALSPGQSPGLGHFVSPGPAVPVAAGAKPAGALSSADQSALTGSGAANASEPKKHLTPYFWLGLSGVTAGAVASVAACMQWLKARGLVHGIDRARRDAAMQRRLRALQLQSSNRALGLAVAGVPLLALSIWLAAAKGWA